MRTLLISCLALLAGAFTPVMASSHSGLSDGLYHLLENWQADGYRFAPNVATHGEHLAWKESVSDIIAVASQRDDADIQQLILELQQRKAVIDALPESAFTETGVSAHYRQVHPYSDTAANLLVLLNLRNVTGVTELNQLVTLNLQTLGTDALCGYNTWRLSQDVHSADASSLSIDNVPDNVLEQAYKQLLIVSMLLLVLVAWRQRRSVFW